MNLHATRLACPLALALALAAGFALADGGEEAPAFSDPARVARFLRNQPARATRLLERTLPQARLDALEAAMFPDPGPAAQAHELRAIGLRLRQIGLGADDPLVDAVNTRAESLAAGAGQEEEPEP